MEINLNLNTWMADMYDTIKSKSITNIIMPASHDSGAYKLDINNSSMWTNDIVKKLKPFKNLACVKSIITNWTVCHHNTIYEQLCKGIRVFDFRVSHDSTANIFYITHTFTCVNMIDVLNDIKKFLNMYPKEIVIVCCKPDWENRGTMYQVPEEFMNYIANNLNGYLFDNIGSFPTYENMIDANKRVLFSYLNGSDGVIWDEFLFNLPWTNTSDVNVKLTGLENSLKDFKSEYYNVLDFTLTPQTSNIVKSVFLGGCCLPCSTLYGLSQKINVELATFIEKNKGNFGNLSGFFFDFPSVDAIKMVISLNKN